MKAELLTIAVLSLIMLIGGLELCLIFSGFPAIKVAGAALWIVGCLLLGAGNWTLSSVLGKTFVVAFLVCICLQLLADILDS